jgi:hypothetical protein
MMARDIALTEGERVGRYVVLRDRDGRLHAVAPGGVGAVCEVDDGTLVMLPAGRMIHIEHSMSVVLDWLDGKGPGL